LVIFDLEMETNLKYKNITEKILGASFDVHSFLGNGFQEVIPSLIIK
jgi:hypothetical protein